MYGEREEMFPGGYDQVTRALAQGLDIRLQHVVASVHYSADQAGVRVTCKNGALFTGQQCLVALPLGCLQAGDVSFEPALPEWKTKALSVCYLVVCIYVKIMRFYFVASISLMA